MKLTDSVFLITGGSSGLGAATVQMALAAGARVGTVADAGPSSALSFEVRHRSETLDPRPWLGL